MLQSSTESLPPNTAYNSSSGSSNGASGKLKDLIGAAERAAGKTQNKELGKDAFLELLVAQLKNQDPMAPMDNTQMVAQMAQFSALEQMQNLNKLMEAQQNFQNLTQASTFIGKYGKLETLAADGETVETITGRIDEVRQVAGETKIVIGGKEYNPTDLINVADKAFPVIGPPIPGAGGGAS